MANYDGGCHCGAVRVRFQTERPASAWPLRRCTCSFCVRFGGVYTSDPNGSLQIRSDSALKRYRFGQRSADFLSCPTCGVYLGAMCVAEGQALAVIPVRVLNGLVLELEKAEPMDFDEESIELRNARRRRNWTPLVLAEPGT